MALKKDPPISSKEFTKDFRTRAEADVYVKETKAQYKGLGISTHFDIKLNPLTNQWRVVVALYE